MITSGRWLIALTSLLMAFATGAAGDESEAPASRPRRVLVVESFGPQFEPFREAFLAFRQELLATSSEPIEFFEISLETARFDEGGVDRPLAEYVRLLCEQRPPDLVVSIAAPAARFCARHRERLFPDAPFLAAAIEHRHLDRMDLGPDFAAVTFRVDLPGLVEDLREILPGTRRVAAVFGSAPLEKFWAAEARREWQGIDAVELEWLADLPWPEVLERAARLPEHSALVFATMNIDARGVPYEHEAALRGLAAEASAPVFGVFEEQLGRGVVGGRLVSLGQLGSESARTALRILQGEDAASIPERTVRPGHPVFDARQLQRWHIDTDRLPPGSEVRFGEATFWETYGSRILAAAVLVVLETALLVLLLVNWLKRRSAEARVRENQRHMSLAADAARLGLWTLDPGNDRLWITREGRALFGWGDSEPIGFQRFLSALRAEERDPVRRNLERTLEEGGQFGAECRLATTDGDGDGDGDERWIALRGRAEPGPVTGSTFLRGVFLDVTDRKRTDLEIQELRRELAHLGRVSVLGQLVASLAHELGQPLGAILRNADAAALLLESASPDLEEVRAIVEDIRRDDARARAVIDRVRASLVRRPPEMRPLSLPAIVEDVLAIVRADAASRRVTVESVVPAGLPRLRGDRVQVQQVLLNLVANSMDALDGVDDGERCVTVAGRQLGEGTIEVTVSDTGPGITPEDRHRLFDPFFTTKTCGMGMGLPIAVGIVEEHGGRLWVENGAKAGAVFRFTVPTDRTEPPG